MPGTLNERVLIIGAGISSLALAQGLRKHNIPFTVFERDVTFDARSQGYRVKVFADTVADLKYVLDDELWQEFEATCAESAMGESTINAVNGDMISSRAYRGPIPYTVDRSVFRSVLLKGLDDNIVWGRTFVKYELNLLKDSQAIAYFADGSTEVGALIVGGDGTRSAVRKQYLPDFPFVDTEGCCIYGKTPITPEFESNVAPKVLQWITLIRDEAPLIQDIILGGVPVTMTVDVVRFPNRDNRTDLPQNYVYWAILLPKSLLAPDDEVLLKVLERYPKDLSLMLASEWDPSVRAILEHQEPAASFTVRIFSAFADLPKWESDSRITLMGDAIHTMSPAGGVGAVTALKDAATLTRMIVERGITKASIGAYEEAMRSYASASIRRGFAGANRLYGMRPFSECKVVQI